jgi:hypothetical protein
MKNLKKVTVLLVALAMLFVLAAPVFASSTPADVIGTDYESAVGKLAALGIVQGLTNTQGVEDGDFAPGREITRAEFAKIAAYLVGLGEAAEAASGMTKFSDVPASHWASGYINLAVNEGLVKGYPDGTFKPSANVTNAEVLTVLVRALGLGPVVEQPSKGTWPSNYIAQASQSRITTGISGLTPDVAATRGNVGRLAWETLTKEKWGPSSYDGTGGAVTYAKGVKTLLELAFGDNVTYTEEIVVTDAFLTTTDLAFEYGTLTFAGIGNKEVVFTGIDINGLAGKKVEIMTNDDDEVIYVRVLSDSVEGLVKEFDDNKIVLENGKELRHAGGNIFKINFQGAGTYAQAETAIGDQKAYFSATLNDNGVVASANFFVAETMPAVFTTQFVVKEINSDNEVICLGDTVIFDIDEIVDADADIVTVFVKNGKSATEDDIKVGDVVTYVEMRANAFYVLISDNKVTGTLTGMTRLTNASNADARYKVTVAGNSYTMPVDGSAMMTTTGDLEDAEAITSDYENFYGEEVVLTLNALGQLVLSSTEVSEEGKLYGIVTSDVVDAITGRAIEIRGTDGVKAVYNVKGDKFKLAGTSIPNTAATAFTTANLEIGDFVQYKVDADGKLVRQTLLSLIWLVQMKLLN